MSKEGWMKIKLDRALTAVALTALVAAPAAFAATPIKGATYKGRISRATNVTFSISFKVNARGKRVGNFKLSSYPVYCQGGGFGSLQQASGTITKKATSKVKLPIYFAPAHSRQGFVIVTGRFAKKGKESGKVTTAFTHATSCNGTSSYTTKG